MAVALGGRWWFALRCWCLYYRSTLQDVNSDPVEVYVTGEQITHPGELGSDDMIDMVATTIRFANSLYPINLKMLG